MVDVFQTKVCLYPSKVGDLDNRAMSVVHLTYHEYGVWFLSQALQVSKEK